MKEINDILNGEKGKWSDDFFQHYFKDGFGTELNSSKNS